MKITNKDNYQFFTDEVHQMFKDKFAYVALVMWAVIGLSIGTYIAIGRLHW